MALRRLCSKTFRNIIKNQYPGLGDNPDYWRHMARLLFNYNQDGVPISQYHIAFDFRVMNLLHNNKLNASKYINDFRTNVFNYTLIDYDHANHKCRYAKFKLPECILHGLEKEYIMPTNSKSRIVFVTGAQYTKNTRSKFRREDYNVSKLITNSRKDMYEVAKKFQTYLNELPANRFNRLCKYIPFALNALYDKDSSGNFLIKPINHKDQRDILLSLNEQPQPFYVPSKAGNTVRLFEINKGLQGLHSHLRGILTQDCIEVDIQNAHLAIVAKLWDLKEVNDFLSTGRSIGSELIPAMGFDYPNKNLKAILKDYLYGIIYGMSENNLYKGLTQILGPTPYSKFRYHNLVEEMISGRNKQMDKLRTLSGSNKHYILPSGEKVKPYFYSNKQGELESNLTSILSQEATEYEMLLIQPIIDLAIKSKSFDVILYQFDGMTLDFRDKRRSTSTLKKLKKEVECKAGQLGINTTLTW